MRRILLAAPLATALAAPLSAQVYIDVGAQAGTPSGTYHAAHDRLPAGYTLPATWNAVPADATGFPLVRGDGSPSGIWITIAGGTPYAFDHPSTSGDDAALLDDGAQSAGTLTITLAGLDSAACAFDYAYVLGDDPAQTTRVRWNYGTMPAEAAEADGGGAWTGQHVEGESYVVHEGDHYCDFLYGVDLVIEISPAPGSTIATIAGLQFAADPFFGTNSFCNEFDGSLVACPCGPGLPGTGCDVPIPAMQGGGTTGGVGLLFTAQEHAPVNRATLTAVGFPTGSNAPGILMRNTGFDPGSPVVFGDGLRCVDATTSPGTFARLGAAVSSGGISLHAFGHGAMAGSGSFFYQLWFRSTTPYCTPSAFNTSAGRILDW